MKPKLILCLFIFCGFLSLTAKAYETEPNNSRAQANTLALNGTNSGKIDASGDEDWWKVTTTGDGRLDISLTVSNAFYTWVYLYDNNGTELLNSGYTISTFTLSTDGLAAGTYYIKLIPYYIGQLPAYTISNALVVPAQANDVEPNGTRASAKVLPLNGTKTGHVGYYYNLAKDTSDWYKVTTNADGGINLKLTSHNNKYIWVYLYDNDGTTQLAARYTLSDLEFVTDGLAAGTYYLQIKTFYASDYAPYTIANNLIVPVQANDVEPNDVYSQANVLPLNGSKTGHVNYYYNLNRDVADWYKVTTDNDGMLTLNLTSHNGKYVWVYLYDNNGTTLLSSQYTTTSLEIKLDGLQQGTYYIKIATYYSSDYAPYTLSNTLTTYSFAADAEPNKRFVDAKTIPANGSVTGHVNFYYNDARDSVDTWKINYTGSGNLTLQFDQEQNKISNSVVAIWFQVYKDTNAAPIHSSYYYTSSNPINLTNLTQGYYYIKVYPYYNSQFAAYSISSTFTQVNIASINITQATSNGCTNGQLQMQGSGSKPPYTVYLYRFGQLYNTYTSYNTSGFTASNLPPGIYYATAYGDGATGNAYGTSNTKSLLPPATTTGATTNITSNKATLHWTKVDCANGYLVQYRVQGTTPWTQKIVLGNKDNLILTGLAANTTYQFRLATGVGLDTVSNYVLSAFTPIDVFTTSASLMANNYDLNISPNPANSYFIIQTNKQGSDIITASLKDASGRIFWKTSGITYTNLNNTRVNVSGLKPGLYYLEYGTAMKPQSLKVIVNR